MLEKLQIAIFSIISVFVISVVIALIHGFASIH